MEFSSAGLNFYYSFCSRLFIDLFLLSKQTVRNQKLETFVKDRRGRWEKPEVMLTEPTTAFKVSTSFRSPPKSFFMSKKWKGHCRKNLGIELMRPELLCLLCFLCHKVFGFRNCLETFPSEPSLAAHSTTSTMQSISKVLTVANRCKNWIY